MLRSLKNTRDHIVFLQKRINVRNQFAFESDLLTYGEPASIHKLFEKMAADNDAHRVFSDFSICSFRAFFACFHLLNIVYTHFLLF